METPTTVPEGGKVIDLERKEELDLARAEVIDEKLDDLFGVVEKEEKEGEEEESEAMLFEREKLAKAMLEVILIFEKRRREIVLRYMNKKYPNTDV